MENTATKDNQDGTSTAYPRHDIAPNLKDENWGMLYAKAAWNDWQYSIPRTCFYNAADKYQEQRLYAQGKQPINKYKKWWDVDNQENETMANLDWEVRPIAPKYRDIAVSRMAQQQFNIVATPIDPQAQAELKGIYADMTAKLAMQGVMNNPELGQHPLLKSNPGDPLDPEEMQMRVDFGEQFNRSKDAEQAIALAFYENAIKEINNRWLQDMYDCGVTGYREWLDKLTNKPKVRVPDPEAVITNHCKHRDFRDLVHAGELWDVALVDLAEVKNDDGTPKFTDETLTWMADNIAGRWANGNMVNRSSNYYRGYDKFKVKVLDIEFFSWNNYYYNLWVNSKGNLNFEWQNSAQSPQGRRKYKGKRIKVVYRVKWIVGTDHCYDFELAENMKRSNNPKKKAETSLSYRFFAPNFYDMRCLSMMERLIPVLDDLQMDFMRIQNLKARLIPNGFWIDLDALEATALQKGGKNMTTLQLLDMFYKTGILVGRSKDIMGENVNYKPVIPLQNSIAAELTGMYQSVENNMMQLESMIGFNDATAGQTINPKTLNGAVQQMDQTTNNALFPMQYGARWLMEQLANDMLIRTQQAVKKGGVSGYAPALGTNTLKFMEISPAIGAREYGILLEERPTDDQKQILLQQLGIDQQNQLVDSSDVMYIMNTYNIKQAQEMLAYKVKKNKQAMQQAKQGEVQQQGEQQQAMQAQASQLRKDELVLEYALKKDLANVEGAWVDKAAATKAKSELSKVDAQLVADIIMQAMQGSAQAGGGTPQPGQQPQQQGPPQAAQPNPGPSPQGSAPQQ